MVSCKQSECIIIEITSGRLLTIIFMIKKHLEEQSRITCTNPLQQWHCMSRVLLEDAADSTGGGVLFVADGTRDAEFVVAVWGLLLLLDVEGATQLGEGDGGLVRPLLRCHELVLPAEKLVFALAWQPYTSLSALQAKWNKRVIFA
jgi:hypothetical protein